MGHDLGPKSDANDEYAFEGGLVLEPVPGICKGVVAIDGKSPYKTTISKSGHICGQVRVLVVGPGLEREAGRGHA